MGVQAHFSKMRSHQPNSNPTSQVLKIKNGKSKMENQKWKIKNGKSKMEINKWTSKMNSYTKNQNGNQKWNPIFLNASPGLPSQLTKAWSTTDIQLPPHGTKTYDQKMGIKYENQNLKPKPKTKT